MGYLRGPDLLNPYAWLVSALRLMSRPRHPVLPSVGVGNLRTGGTGKTPLVAELTRHLPHPAIITLGYRRKRRGCFTSQEHPSPEYLGDEGYMLFKRTGVPVIACKDRLRGAEMAKALGAETVIYDDVFQYFRIRPHFSILLLRPSDVRSHVLPFGPLREPFGAYRFADAVVFNLKTDEDASLPPLDKPTFRMRYRIDGLVVEGKVVPVEGRRVFAFCGIADPLSFIGALKKAGAKVVGRRIFPDHWWIDRRTVEDIRKEARRLGAIPVCTEKDFYRIGDPTLPYLKVSVEIEDGLVEMMRERLSVALE
ncbi:MAG: tetraacyldisaccharide 4'-kinase [Thermotogae bacterium]|nr:tetraacyldisaccharide 4'-kinase [Thermotogota bacterium]